MINKAVQASFRILSRNKRYALINLIGLSLGITSSLIIFLVISFELSYDDYHPDSERTYRVVSENTQREKASLSSGAPYQLPQSIRNDFADVEYVTIVDANMGQPVISVTRTDGSRVKFKEKGVAYVDPDYFNIFHYEWVAGSKKSFEKEKSVVITESIALKYFGHVNVLGKYLNVSNEYDAVVSGVVADPPLNTDLGFKILLSNNTGKKRGWDSWGSTSSAINCYLKLLPKATRTEFENKLIGWHVKYYTGRDAEDAPYIRYFLQPLSEVHFDTRFGNFSDRTRSYASLLALGLIGLLLVATACVNFVNLNTVLLINRSKECAVRKILGSSRRLLAFQFLLETFMITFAATLISIGLAELALTKADAFIGFEMPVHAFSNLDSLLFTVCILIVVTLLSGLYPAIHLASFNPIKALKNKLSAAGEGLMLRRSLIVFQLVVSQSLIVGTIIIVQQLNFVANMPLGLDPEAVVEFEVPEPDKHGQALRDRLALVAGVENITLSNTGTSSPNEWSTDFEARVNGTLIKEDVHVKFADENYISTYGLQLLAGQNLLASDSATRFLINETMLRELGITEPAEAIGISMKVWGYRALVTGVVADFNTSSLHERIRPTVIMNGRRYLQTGAVKMSTDQMHKTIASVAEVWETFYPNYVFQYTFLNDTIAEFYAAEQSNSYLVGIFAAIAIAIGCIGLFGLISFMAKNRTKEIGIRKTLGATVQAIILMLSKEFIILLIVAFIISTPITFYFMKQWLDHFAYRIPLNALTFLLGVTITMVIMFLTVGIKSYQAAMTNPVDALKDE